MDVVTPVSRRPEPGETLLVGDIRLVPGGKGANAAVAAARLDAQVRFIGCVGDDAFGRTLRDSLTHEGIDCEHLRTGKRGSGTAVILLDQNTGQNAIMVGPGTNYELTLPRDDTPFQWADIMMLQLETPVAINIEAVRRARAHGVRVVLDPAPAVDDLPEELLTLADIVSPNESELATLTGRRLDGIDDALSAARSLLHRGVKELVVKLGERGALRVNHETRQHFEPVKIKPVDTTAAGDAFTAAMCVALADGFDLGYAIQQGCVAGALACTRLGAQPSLPTRQQVSDFAAHGPA
jgi:ribokinase